MSDWISVNDRLPEDSLPKHTTRKMIKCLVATDKGTVKQCVRQRWMDSNGKMLNWQWNKDLHAIPTHWMHLPNPPSKKKEIQIIVSDEELNKIANETADEMGIEMVAESKHICANCRWYKPWYNLCEHPQRCVDFGGYRYIIETCEKWENTKMTNAEKLRILNIEELADFLLEVSDSFCDICGNSKCMCIGNPKSDCKNQVIRWLNSEVKSE